MATQKLAIVAVGTPAADATALANANDCGGYYTGIPPMWATQAVEESWTLPCVVTQSLETGAVIAWAPA